jgi:uncharacterized membrane protein
VEAAAGTSAPHPSQAAASSDGGLSDNAAGALAYFTFIPAILFLLIDPFKTRPFVRFHAFQCLFLHAASMALWICVVIITTVASFIPGGFLLSMLSFVIWLALLVVWILVVVKAFQGEQYKLPVLGDLAAKQV